MYVGYVKDNRDVQNMGRLKVHIPDLGGDPHDDKSWFICSYATPFGGQTPVKFIDSDLQDYNQTQTSYGFWAVPPDVNTQVLVTFSNGDSTRAFWFACIYDNYMNQMVPGMAASDSARHYGPETTSDDCPLPTAEYNKYSKANRGGKTKVVPNDEKKPIQKHVAEGLKKQGLILDDIRGTTTTSARRESPSKVFGWSTPGPLDPDGRKGYPYDVSRGGKTDELQPINRKGGHQFYMDDSEEHEHIRIRTRSGAQVLISETHGMIYICNRDGTAWLELSENGNVDVYGAESMSIRSELDINIRADRDLNLEAGQNINIKAAKSYREASEGQSAIIAEGTGAGGNISIHAVNDMNTTVQENLLVTVVNGNYDVSVAGAKTETYGLELGIKSLNYNLETSGNSQFEGTLHAQGSISSASDVSSRVQSLSALFQHTHMYIPGDNGLIPTEPFGFPGLQTSATGPQAATAMTPGIYTKSNVVLDIVESGNKEYCLTYKREDVSTINKRFVTHEPCVEHSQNGTGNG